MGNTPDYISRICYNKAGWARPSGSEGKSRSDNAFEGEYGYGHEEWLFNRDYLLEVDGVRWKYAYLQGVDPSRVGGRRLAGSTVDVGLFTIRSNGDREYVARIPALRILTNEEAAEAWAKLRGLGYVDQMAEEVEKVDGNVDRFRAAKGHEAVNVRFLPDGVEYDERFARPVSRSDGLHKLPGHYVLYEHDPKKYGDLTWTRGEIPLALRRTGAVSRSGCGPTIADDAHNRHQNALILRLAQIYGAGAVVPEATAGRGRADIEIRDAGARIIFEVKPDLDPGAAIRSAVGQLLEYAVWPPAHGAKDRLRLVVAAPAEETQTSRMYLEALRSKFKVPVEYVQTFEEPTRIQWRR